MARKGSAVSRIIVIGLLQRRKRRERAWARGLAFIPLCRMPGSDAALRMTRHERQRQDRFILDPRQQRRRCRRDDFFDLVVLDWQRIQLSFGSNEAERNDAVKFEDERFIAAFAAQRKARRQGHQCARMTVVVHTAFHRVVQSRIERQDGLCEPRQRRETDISAQDLDLAGQPKSIERDFAGSHRGMRRYTSTSMTIVLASTSPYRRELLQRLRVAFEVADPAVDEARTANEPPRALALRLAQAKAASVAAQRPADVVIGSDQVAELNGEPIGKPLDHATALAQLERMQGRTLVFHTALAVIGGGRTQVDSVPTTVTFRRLGRAALDRYLTADQPYDCAGSAKVESLGIALLERVESDDPTALIGLPLIRLTSMLAAAGVDVLGTVDR